MSIKYSFVLPCYNESENINLILERFDKFKERTDFELVLVNNGSTDNTQEYLDQALMSNSYPYLRVLNIPVNKGYGYGIHKGLQYAKGEVLAFSHADIQTPPEDLFKAANLIDSNEINLDANLIKGYRINKAEDSFLTIWLSRIVRWVTGTKLVDINGQPKMFSRGFFESMKHPPKDFTYDTYILYLAKLNAYEIKTFDVKFGERLHSESKWSASLLSKYRTILSYLKNITIMSWRFRSFASNPFGQLIRFIYAGVATNVANYVVFITLFSLISTHYLLASAAGYITGFISGFFLNRNFTFGCERQFCFSQFTRFCLANLASFLLSLGAIALWVKVGLPPQYGQFFSIAVGAICNFIAYKLYVFTLKNEVAYEERCFRR